jgi:hypothetical protein
MLQLVWDKTLEWLHGVMRQRKPNEANFYPFDKMMNCTNVHIPTYT